MLELCNKNSIGAESETITANSIEAAYEPVIISRIRRRLLINVATI